jgi:hypothetical protein
MTLPQGSNRTFCFLYLITQGVVFIPLPNTAVLSLTKPASAGTFRDSCCARENKERNALYLTYFLLTLISDSSFFCFHLITSVFSSSSTLLSSFLSLTHSYSARIVLLLPIHHTSSPVSPLQHANTNLLRISSRSSQKGRPVYGLRKFYLNKRKKIARPRSVI